MATPRRRGGGAAHYEAPACFLDHGIDITNGPYHLDYGTAMQNFYITGPNWTQPIHQDSYVWYYSPHSVSRVGYWPEKEAKEVEKTFN